MAVSIIAARQGFSDSAVLGRCVTAEQMETSLGKGEPIDISEHALLCSTLTRLVSRLGINRVPRDLTPTLAQYLQSFDEDKTTKEEAAQP